MKGRAPARARLRRVALSLAAALLTAACGGSEAPPGPRRHVVEIRAFEYHPASLDLAAGDTVVWVNRDAVPHTATAADGGWNSGSIPGGGSWSRAFVEAQGGAYSCTFHPGMVGRLVTR